MPFREPEDRLIDLQVTPFAVDLSDPEGPGRLIAHVVDNHGRVDVLVNNMGAAPRPLGGILGTSDADFQAWFDLNFFAALRATRAAVTEWSAAVTA